ncbi:retrovirus-related pol polyprotein from transposon TNT 1-94, partial [Tanacetum coccineum]
ELNASVEEKDSLTQVWHKRLGHISEAGLQVLEKQGLFGKKSIDYVHSDLRGSSQVESLGGKRFKHEAFGKFKEWKQLVENQTRRTVKKLRTDNGLEFCNRKFEQLCIESGIARNLIVVGMPQQNGLAERMNRTLMDKGVKGYKLYRLDDESPKIVTSRNVVFNESVMYKDILKDSGADADKSVEELHVEVELQRLNNHTLKEDQTDQEDGDDEDAGDQETDQTPDLTNYQLARDREPRTNTMLIACKSKAEIGSTKSLLKKEFDIKNLGEGKKILDMDIVRDRRCKILRVSQSGNVFKILNNFRIDNGKSVKMSLGGHFKLSLKDFPVRDCDVERVSKVPYA